MTQCIGTGIPDQPKYPHTYANHRRRVGMEILNRLNYPQNDANRRAADQNNQMQGTATQ